MTTRRRRRVLLLSLSGAVLVYGDVIFLTRKSGNARRSESYRRGGFGLPVFCPNCIHSTRHLLRDVGDDKLDVSRIGLTDRTRTTSTVAAQSDDRWNRTVDWQTGRLEYNCSHPLVFHRFPWYAKAEPLHLFTSTFDPSPRSENLHHVEPTNLPRVRTLASKRERQSTRGPAPLPNI